ncbi:MlaD family protein [Nocardioides panacisoli]|uniref:MlaD family protein n=1 Tax=Nocardioides panacisoli TaxID=627624 RepID=A0ABP7J3E5_9ACTN
MLKLLTDKLVLSAVGVVVVFLFAVAYIFSAVLDQPLTSRPVTVTVDLAQSGGLFEGSNVTYRGVQVGKVTQIVPTDSGVAATIKITSGTKIPQDAMAKVRSLSPVGEQYLDFQPQSADGPYLESGDTVSAQSTDIPKSLSSTVVAVNKVLDQIDDKKLKSVLQDLSTGLAGTGDDLGQILDQGNQILATLDEIWPQTDRVITNGGRVLGIVNDNATSLRTLATRSKEFASFLKNYTPEFSDVLDRTPGQLKQLRSLVDDAEEVLPGFLSVGVSFDDMFLAYEPHLRTLLQEYSPGLRALIAVLHDGRLNVQIIPHRTRKCDYGTTRHLPWDPERHPFQTGGHCAASFPTLQRGAAHAPGPVR